MASTSLPPVAESSRTLQPVESSRSTALPCPGLQREEVEVVGATPCGERVRAAHRHVDEHRDEAERLPVSATLPSHGLVDPACVVAPAFAAVDRGTRVGWRLQGTARSHEHHAPRHASHRPTLRGSPPRAHAGVSCVTSRRKAVVCGRCCVDSFQEVRGARDRTG